MSEFNKALLIANVYRYLLIIAGVAFGYFGYRLFRVGFYEKAGELKAAWGEHNLTLKQVAPGVFFALFGVAVIGIAVVRGITVEQPRHEVMEQPKGSSQSASLPLKPLPEPDIPVERNADVINPGREDRLKEILGKAFDCKKLTSEQCGKVKEWLTNNEDERGEGIVVHNAARGIPLSDILVKALDCEKLTREQCSHVKVWLVDRGVVLPAGMLIER